MNKFDVLTKYIPLIPKDRIGEFVIDKIKDGSPNRSLQMPYVDYSDMVDNFVQDVYSFSEDHADMKLTNYQDLLKENNIEWNMGSMKNADISNFNAQTVLALIMGAIRLERFGEGVLLDLFENGTVLKWLERLNRIE